MDHKIRVAVLGASGYTGSEFLRLALGHPSLEIAALSANAQAGRAYEDVFPSFVGLDLPALATVEDIDFSAVDVVVLCLPHTKSQQIVADLWDRYPALKFVDLAADFRLRDTVLYSETYTAHLAPDIQPQAVYGLTEHYREPIAQARLVACPGCFPTGALSLILPLVKAGMVAPNSIIVDSKTGVTGAGRKVDQAFLFAEVNESVHAYALGGHRHRPEMEQEVAAAAQAAESNARDQRAEAGAGAALTFTPHLVGNSRGILTTAYMSVRDGYSVSDAQGVLAEWSAGQSMLHYCDDSAKIATRFVRGTNRVALGLFAGRSPGQLIGLSAIDNLTKGSSGQALQNLNLMFGFDEALGLKQTALFP